MLGTPVLVKLRAARAAGMLAAALLLPAAHAAAQPPPSDVPLLAAHARQEVFAFGSQFADSDLLITEDGVSHSTLAVSQSPPIGLPGWTVTRSVFRATSEQLADLKAAIAAAQLGVQPGGCVLPSIVPSSGTYDLVWYGRGTRSNAISMTLAGGTGVEPTCPKELSTLVAMLQLYGGIVAGE